MRVVRVRTGVVLDKDGGALGKMLPFFKAGVGGPVAGGAQLMPWIHADDVVGIYLRALDDAAWSRPGQRDRARSPSPTRTSPRRSAGRCTGPRSPPCRRSRSSSLYGDMSEIVTKGQNAVPRRTLELGYRHAHPRPRRGAALRTPVRLTARYGPLDTPRAVGP